MSLITDLLSKIKHEGPKREVPPMLKDAAMQSAARRSVRNKMIVPAVIAVIVIAAGVLTTYLLKPAPQQTAPEVTAQLPKTVAPPPPVEPALQPAPPQAVLPPESPQSVKPQAIPESTVTPPKTATMKTEAAPAPSKPSAKAPPKAEVKPIALAPVSEQKPVALAAKTEPIKKAQKAPVHTVKKSRVAKKAVATKPAAPTVAAAGGAIRELKQEKAAAAQVDVPTAKASPNKDIYLYTAKTSEMQNDYRRAASDLKEVLKAEPRNYIVMNNISSLQIQAGAYDDAIKYANNALAIRRNYVPSLINLGIANIQLDNEMEGESYLQQALSLEPSNRYALLNLGLLNERRSVLNKANEYFLKLASKNDAQGYLGLARIAEKQGQVKDAINIYREVLSLDTTDTKAQNMAKNRLSQLLMP